MRALLDAVRNSLPPSMWSRGVELARLDAVRLAPSPHADTSEIQLQVVMPHGGGSALVSLYVDDAEWDCDCQSKADACVHVAMAAIAWSQAKRGDKDLTALKTPHAHLAYYFREEAGGLALVRYVVEGAQKSVLAVPIVVRQKAQGARLVAQPSDLAVDALLVHRPQGALGTALLHRLLAALIDAPHVFLHDQPIRVSEPCHDAVVALYTRPDGSVLVQKKPPKSVQQVFANGAARMGPSLVALMAPILNAEEKRWLTAGRVFLPSDLAHLYGTVLPGLSRKLSIASDAPKSPSIVEMPPRLEIVASYREDADSLEPSKTRGVRFLSRLVYGEPTAAFVQHDKLVSIGQGLVVPRRQHIKEQQLATSLRDALNLVCGQASDVMGASAVAAIARIKQWAEQNNVVFRDEDSVARRFALHGTLGLKTWDVEQSAKTLVFEPRGSDDSLNDDAHDFGFNFMLSDANGHAHRASAEQVVAAMQRGEPLVPLLDGGFAALPAGWYQAHGERLRRLLAARQLARLEAGQDKRRPQGLSAWACADIAVMCQSFMQSPPAFAQHAARALSVLDHNDETLLTSQMLDLPNAIEPRPYQRRGIEWLCALSNAGLGTLLADDMGLGKTLQAIASISGRTLIIVPTSVLFNWQQELSRFRPSLKVCLFHGANRTLDETADVVVTSYGILRSDLKTLTTMPFRRTHSHVWDLTILDEAQLIKNADSQAAQAAYILAETAFARMALSGTPIENAPDELYSLFTYLNRGMLGSREDFAAEIGDPLLQGNNQQRLRAAELLHARAGRLILRRRKSDVAQDLPQRSESILYCQLDQQERAAYDAIHAATQQDVVAKLAAGANPMQALEALLRLRQAACHSGLLPGSERTDSSKVNLLVDSLMQAKACGHRCLVFSQWTQLLNKVEGALNKNALTFCRLDGQTRDRKKVVETFMQPDGPLLMLISLKAGGTGLNLTQADHVFFLDPWWNPAVEAQAADRAHRIGQTRPVMIHRLVAQNTVEDKILALQAEKRAIAEAVFDGQATDETSRASQKAFGRKDLLALLQD